MATIPPSELLAPALLEELVRTRMPFGKHAGWLLLDLPEPYVLWLARQGGLHGRLGVLFASLVEIKVNGLEPLLAPLIAPEDRRPTDQPEREARRRRRFGPG